MAHCFLPGTKVNWVETTHPPASRIWRARASKTLGQGCNRRTSFTCPSISTSGMQEIILHIDQHQCGIGCIGYKHGSVLVFARNDYIAILSTFPTRSGSMKMLCRAVQVLQVLEFPHPLTKASAGKFRCRDRPRQSTPGGWKCEYLASETPSAGANKARLNLGRIPIADTRKFIHSMAMPTSGRPNTSRYLFSNAR